MDFAAAGWARGRERVGARTRFRVGPLVPVVVVVSTFVCAHSHAHTQTCTGVCVCTRNAHTRPRKLVLRLVPRADLRRASTAVEPGWQKKLSTIDYDKNEIRFNLSGHGDENK